MATSNKLLVMIILAVAALLTGCATQQDTAGPHYSYTARGIGIGALAGASLGTLTGGGGAAAAAGAIIGGITGGAIGNTMDRQAAELRSQLQGSGVQVVRQQETIKLVMPENITFDFDKSDIKTGFYPTLNKVVASLKKYPGTTIVIAGYTDNIGTKEYNIKLSERRAQSVKNYLAQQGVKRHRLHTVGYGMSNPIASNDSKEGRAENRRVEMTIK